MNTINDYPERPALSIGKKTNHTRSYPRAFLHPRLGYVDAFVMHRSLVDQT